MIVPHSILLRVRTTLEKKIVEKVETHILCYVTSFQKSRRLYHAKKYDRAKQATNDEYNRAHAHCMLDNEGYRHTLIIRNTYCSFAAKMITRTRPIITLYVPCLSCSVLGMYEHKHQQQQQQQHQHHYDIHDHHGHYHHHQKQQP